jgi:class 3 adenylate cyclase
MSTILSLRDLTAILQVFTQEMTIVVISNHGYILKKYVGDAIIAYFLVTKDNDNNNNNDFQFVSGNAISCPLNMLIIIVQQGINPILKECGFPEVHVKIGIDSGENANS